MEYMTKPINPIINEMKINSAIRDRRLYLTDVLDEDLAFEICYFLRRIYDIDKKNNIKDEDKIITIICNCYGGSVIHGNAIIGLIEFLKSENYKIIALVEGFCYSMAFDIVICCSERIGYPLSQYMIHQTQLGNHGELAELERDVNFNKKMWEQSIQYYTKYTKLTRERLEEIYKCKENYFMLADEALELGVIDKIIP